MKDGEKWFIRVMNDCEDVGLQRLLKLDNGRHTYVEVVRAWNRVCQQRKQRAMEQMTPNDANLGLSVDWPDHHRKTR